MFVRFLNTEFNDRFNYYNIVTDEVRPDPDLLLAAIKKLDAQEKRGKLKVFFGMAAGVGKTYAMLEAAHKEKDAGRDVVIGYVETHGRKETDALVGNLPLIPRKSLEYRGIAITEMDIDAVLARRPHLALVDELAHTNAPGSRHPKRYQDVLELLEAGIDVYTTLNVQHVASRSDTVRQITGSTMAEIVPDSVLDIAEIELIDLPPEELITRLDEGKVYLPERAETALFNFFREGNLTALREMALRLTAERVGQDVRDYMQTMQIEGPWKSGHRLLVAISPSPLSEQMIRWTRRLADSFNSPWVAVYVETSRVLGEEDQSRLTRNLELARELGAEVVTTSDEDIVRGLLRVARHHNVTQIVVGKPGGHPLFDFFKGGSVLRRLVRESGNIDIHVVRADKDLEEKPFRNWRLPEPSTRPQYFTALGVVAAITLAGFLLNPLIKYRAVALIFLMANVVLALFVGRGPMVVAATATALLWNYFFLPPTHTFYITSTEDALMFGMYFVIALVMGQLITRIRAQEKAERSREERATALYLMTRELADATGRDEILKKVVEQMKQVFKAEIAILLPDTTGTLSRQPHSASTFAVTDKEHSVAAWVFQHAKPAGKFTDSLPLAEALYLPLNTAAGVFGVMGVHLLPTPMLTINQRNLLDTFVRQIALVLDRQQLREKAEQNRLLMESERLGKTLLNSISHEMRTPIAAIASAASGLGDEKLNSRPELQRAFLGEISEAAERLNRLVGNLLDITRLESGHVKPKMDWCDVKDLIHVALKRNEKQLAQHKVSVSLADSLPLVRMDFVLMEQVLNNLLLNAAAYTPAETPVEIAVRVEGPRLVMTVADRGPGLPPEALIRIFDKFYRAPTAPAGGTGLGLSIVKGFVEAQDGSVKAENRAGGGAIFTVTLPLGESPTVPEQPHE